LTRGDEQRPAWTYAFGLAVRALVRTVAGDFTQAAADAEQALRRADFERCRAESASLAAITLAIASVRLDDGARAREVLDGLDMARTSESPLVWHNYLMARAAVFADAGDVDAAVDCYHRCGRGLADAGIVNPLITEWWYEATLLLASHQRAQEAVALVRHGERLVQRWPVPRARGMALTARALVAEPGDRVGLLTEAVRVLGDTSAQFEHQRAELLLGRELLRRGDLVDARRHLRRASALAVHCGARTAAHAARELVLVAGGRMPSLTGARTDMLTSRELEVATRAAAGASNREIAENLFVTARTVEVHLTGAYRKLGIAGRDGLARALAHLDQDRDDEA
jgi:DNA-binding CsgD family transcriptional regulator